jgi:hypothetical protein
MLAGRRRGVQSRFRLYAAGSDFWNKKEPAEWSADEIDKLVTRSPWAKAGQRRLARDASRGYCRQRHRRVEAAGGGGMERPWRRKLSRRRWGLPRWRRRLPRWRHGWRPRHGRWRQTRGRQSDARISTRPPSVGRAPNRSRRHLKTPSDGGARGRLCHQRERRARGAAGPPAHRRRRHRNRGVEGFERGESWTASRT